MGKKVELKKTENPTKSQVICSKRRTGLIKKARETSISRNMDVASPAFSPSGRVSKFCNQNRIEDMLDRYINQTAEKRHPHIKNVEEKMEELKLLDRIKGEENKLLCLDNQIEQMEKQIKISTLESELRENYLSGYEPDPSSDTSLAQLMWCEKKLKHSLQRVTERKRMVLANLVLSNEQLRIKEKKEMERSVLLSNLASSNGQLRIQNEQSEMERSLLLSNLASFNEQLRIQKEQKEMERKARNNASISHDFGGKDQADWGTQHPYSTQILMQLDPWLSPHGPKARQALLKELSPEQKMQLFPVDNKVKLFDYTYQAPIQGKFGHHVPVMAQPQQYPAQTITHNWNNHTGPYDDGIVPMSQLYGNGTNYHLNSSVNGNCNTNINHWNQNSIVNNPVKSSSSSNDYYSTNIKNGDNDSIPYNAPIIFESVNNDLNDKNNICDTNKKHPELPNINNCIQNSIANNAPISPKSFNSDMKDKISGSDTIEKEQEAPNDPSVKTTEGNDTVKNTEGTNVQVGSWDTWDGFALAENLNSEDIDICF